MSEDKSENIKKAAEGARDFLKDAINPEQAQEIFEKAKGHLPPKVAENAEKIISAVTNKEGPLAGIISKIKETITSLLGKNSAAAAAATATVGAAVPKLVDSAKGIVTNEETRAQAKEKIAGIAGTLKDAGVTFGSMANGNKAFAGGGAVVAADGVRRIAGGLKKDENGKRNIKLAFVGAVETAIGAVTAVAAFKAHGAGTNFTDYVRSAAGKGGEGRSV